MVSLENKIFYHGSFDRLEVGTVMTGRGDSYETDWSHTDFYSILEAYRPDNYLAHKNAVFMVADTDDIDLAGGATDWILEVVPTGEVSRHDLNWSSQISCLLSEGYDSTSEEVKQCANHYWAGTPHPNESVWEYLAHSVTVTAVYEYDAEPESCLGLR